jgi:DNA-binding winged helix-turn-helix (wHTH) protein
LDKRTYHFAGWTLNIRRRRLTSSTGSEVKLTSAEFNLLVALVKAPHQILSRDQLIAATRMHNEEVFDRSVDVLILRLRRKLEDDPSKPKLVKTERGVGYFFGVNVDVAYMIEPDRQSSYRLDVAHASAPVNVSRRRYWRSLLRLSRLPAVV